MKSKQVEMVEIEDKDGNKKMIPRHRIGFHLRAAQLESGREVLVGRDAVYGFDPKAQGGKTLVRLDKKKMSKKEKKAAKRAKFGHAPQTGEELAAREYERLSKLAEKKGWTMPENDVFADEVWIRYWLACEACEQNPEAGRPVAPHRSGGGQQLPQGRPVCTCKVGESCFLCQKVA